MPEGSVELCRESEASYYKTVCSKSQRCRWTLRGGGAQSLRAALSAPARRQGRLPGRLGSERWALGLARGRAAWAGAASAGGLRRSPAPRGVHRTNCLQRCARGSPAACAWRVRGVCARVAAPPHSQPQRRCFPLTSPLGGPAGTGETDATFCQFNGAVCPVVSDLSVKDTRVFGLFGGLFLRAPLNPRV